MKKYLVICAVVVGMGLAALNVASYHAQYVPPNPFSSSDYEIAEYVPPNPVMVG